MSMQVKKKNMLPLLSHFSQKSPSPWKLPTFQLPGRLTASSFVLKSESESPSVVSDSLRLQGLYSPRNSPGQNTRVASPSFLQGIFPTQGLNPGFLHCRQILYQLSHKGSPRILEWVAYPFFNGSSQTRNRNRVSRIAGEFFTNWAIREAFCTNFIIYIYFFLILIYVNK